jgi:hypothetical protein
MNQSALSRRLYGIIIGMAFCVTILYLYISELGRELAVANPEVAFCYWPWFGLIWVTAVPIYGILVHCWLIALEIKKDHSFSEKNARHLKRISQLAAADSAVFLAGNSIYSFLGMNHPGMLIPALIAVFFGIAVAVLSAVLSQLTRKAAEMHKETALPV